MGSVLIFVNCYLIAGSLKLTIFTCLMLILWQRYVSRSYHEIFPVFFEKTTRIGLIFFCSSFRAATLVRRTKGENRRGRSQPLRCGRQRWYGGTRGGETGESAEKQLPTHRVATPWHHTEHTPPTQLLPQHIALFLLRSLTPLVYFLQWWTDLCMPLLDHQQDWCCGFKMFLDCMTWVQRDGAAKDNRRQAHSETKLYVFASSLTLKITVSKSVSIL